MLFDFAFYINTKLLHPFDQILNNYNTKKRWNKVYVYAADVCWQKRQSTKKQFETPIISVFFYYLQFKQWKSANNNKKKALLINRFANVDIFHACVRVCMYIFSSCFCHLNHQPICRHHYFSFFLYFELISTTRTFTTNYKL